MNGLRSLALKAAKGITRVESGLGVSDPTTANTTILYMVDIAAGDVLVDGLARNQAAAADTVLIGAAAWDKSYKIDGTAAVVLTADGKSYIAVIVAINDGDGSATLHAVFGAEADDGSEVAPTLAQIRAALTAADVDWDGKSGMVVARILIQRVAVDTITMTHTDPASDDDLLSERLAGTLFGDAS
jgi:hypothetical protein